MSLQSTASSASLLPGDRAPDFTLNSVLDNKEEQVSLSSLRGQNVLLMFYPVDFGYVTPSEFYTLAPLLPLLADFNCSILAISTEHISSQKNSLATPRSDFSNLGKYFSCQNIFSGLRLDWTGWP